MKAVIAETVKDSMLGLGMPAREIPALLRVPRPQTAKNCAACSFNARTDIINRYVLV